MNETVFYLMSGPAHLPYLVVSLDSLRHHFHGEVKVFAYPESIPVVKTLARKSMLSFEPVLFDPPYRGKNSQFLNKIDIATNKLKGNRLYLDADTTIHGPLDYLFRMAEINGFCATQFNDWKSNGRRIRTRILRLSGKGLDEGAIRKVTDYEYPSLNGGVWAASDCGHRTLGVWHAWTKKALDVFIADEAVLHILQAVLPVLPFFIATGGMWNCSPKFQPGGLLDSNVAIRHYHGDSNVRPEKTEKGWRLWWPMFLDCWERDVGGIRGWCEAAGNYRLNALLQAHKHEQARKNR